MKIQAYKVPAFLNQIPKDVKVFLFYGPEQGLVSEQGDMLAQKLVANPKDPFVCSYVDMPQLTSGDVALDIELNEISMFADEKLIRIRHADEKLLKFLSGCEDLFADTHNFIIIEAGDLDARSKLRKFCEAHVNIAALPCYVEDHRQLTQTIITILKSYNLQAERAAIEYLAINLAANRVMLRSELEKLSIYKTNDTTTLTLEEVKKSLSNQADFFLEDPIWQVMSADTLALKGSFETLLEQGENGVAIVRAALRHIHRLTSARANMDAGLPLDTAMSKLRPPVFYKQKAIFSQQLTKYSVKYLSRIIKSLLQLEFALKQSNSPVDLLTFYQFNQIATFNKRVM